jgi:hypothetical protein
VPGISDHDGIPVIVVSTKPRFIKQNPRKIGMYQKVDNSALKSHLKTWSDKFVNSTSLDKNVNDMYDEFTSTIENAMDSFIPSKMVTKRTTSPWINKKVKRSHKRKQRAYNSHKRLKKFQ